MRPLGDRCSGAARGLSAHRQSLLVDGSGQFLRARAELEARVAKISDGKTSPEFGRSSFRTARGSAVRARRLSSQRVEARIGCRILNVMTALGMPDGVMIE